MANITDAYGTITLRGNWGAEHIKIFTYMLSLHSRFNYSTTVCDCHSDNVNDEYENIFKTLQSSGCLTFGGSGRWAYASNIECFYPWSCTAEDRWKELQEDLKPEYQMSYDAFKVHLEKFIRDMVDLDLSIEFDYKDTDPAMDWVCACVTVLKGKIDVENNSFVYTMLAVEENSKHGDGSLMDHVQIYDDGAECSLNDALYDIQQLFELSDTTLKAVKDMIKSDGNWYGLRPGVYENKEDYPEKFVADLNELLKKEDITNVKESKSVEVNQS